MAMDGRKEEGKGRKKSRNNYMGKRARLATFSLYFWRIRKDFYM